MIYLLEVELIEFGYWLDERDEGKGRRVCEGLRMLGWVWFFFYLWIGRGGYLLFLKMVRCKVLFVKLILVVR